MRTHSKFRKFVLVPLLVLAGAGTVASLATTYFTDASFAATKKPAAHNAARANAQVTFPVIGPSSSQLPPDIPGGAGNATITSAAIFAWQEFIALNWPAAPQTGMDNTRGDPNTNARFGSDSSGANQANQPVVWETYRGKVETFPGVGNPPGYSTSDPNYGFDYAPQYVYGKRATDPKTGVQQNPGGTSLNIQPCSGQAQVSNPSLINLDEINQIGDDTMFAGVVPAAATSANAEPQLIRFLAKGNLTFYKYVAANQYWYHTQGFLTAENNFSSATTYPAPAPIIQLPPGTVLVKAAWRILAPNESAANFHTKTVRYYESNDNVNQIASPVCYREQTWALIALHIIQKTPTAPYFIFATFEYANNILTANGTPVENQNGGPNPNLPPPATPTTPDLQYFDADGKYYGPNYPSGTTSITPPPNTKLPAVVFAQNACSVGQANAQTYYRDLIYQSANSKAPPTPGAAVCVNKRYFQIPTQIVAVNQAAHAALANYGAPGLWQNYKLIEVQWQPFNVADIDTTGNNPSRSASIFYQSNSVVETNNVLQQFFGNQLLGPQNNFFVKSYYLEGATTNGTAYDIYLPPPSGNQFQTYVMGGCMGCHGVAQTGGSDFSFTLGGGPVAMPEYPVVNANGLDTAKGFDLARLATIHYVLKNKSH
jgi:hypothetical protein